MIIGTLKMEGPGGGGDVRRETGGVVYPRIK